MSEVPVLIIDYGMGNLRSVANALEVLGVEAQISARPEDARSAQRIILPGVGAFGDGMRNLRSAGWVEVLTEEVRTGGKPFLGLCLGMQLLATTGTEHGLHAGLGWIPGTVERITCEDPAIRVPHIGWNDVRFTADSRLYGGMGHEQAFYFVHSYILWPENPLVANGHTCHGVEFVASIELNNIFATQYHPEKSQRAGLEVLKNFLRIRG